MNASNDGATCLDEHGGVLAQYRNCETKLTDRRDCPRPPIHWYALHTYPRHEKRVNDYLAWRAIEAFLPLYKTMHRWRNGCKARVELPLFPGYVFVRIDPRERFSALNLPGALSLVGSVNGPWPLPDAEIVTLRARLQAVQFEPHPYLAVGQKVRVKSGPLTNLTGFLVRNAGVARVVLSVELIQQSAAVEVNADDVEPIGSPPPAFDA